MERRGIFVSEIRKCLVGLLVVAFIMAFLPVGALTKEPGKINYQNQAANNNKTEKQNETGNQADLSLSCESAVLMEPITGKVLYEKNKDNSFVLPVLPRL